MFPLIVTIRLANSVVVLSVGKRLSVEINLVKKINFISKTWHRMFSYEHISQAVLISTACEICSFSNRFHRTKANIKWVEDRHTK